MSVNLADRILAHQGVAVLDANSGEIFSYQDLNQKVNSYQEILLKKSGVYGVKCENSFLNIAFYIACLKTNTPLFLLPENITDEAVFTLSNQFKLTGVFGRKHGEALQLFDSEQINFISHSDTAILLSTSGSQFNPRFVRISMQNLSINSFDIISSLRNWENQRAISTLPWHYSYGLSIINTHLLTGNSVILNQQPIVSEKFWANIGKYQATNFGGVPSQYEAIYRLQDKFVNADSIEYITQAGGKLGLEARSEIHKLASKLKRDFYIMYGQTEATARISILFPEQFKNNAESVGRCIGKGIMTEVSGELVFTGGNVCLGYATEAEHLFQKDCNSGYLYTGDRGSVDSDGFIYITGRVGRDVKVSGRRISLDTIESQLEKAGICGYALDLDGKIGIVYSSSEDIEKVTKVLWDDFNILKRDLVFRLTPSIPLLENGKINYRIMRGFF